LTKLIGAEFHPFVTGQGPTMPNRLESAQSPYLRSAAHQPIDWHQWGPEPFEQAGREGKPVLLDIGAVWCHWCHVMDHESYEDPALADQLNRHFVCIKVDRDERPDVDTRYQRAVQALTGQGGWPLTAFLTPQGEVFFGGTYFPPDGRYGRPGFASVLGRVREVFATEPDRVRDQALEIRRLVEQELDDAAPGLADADLLQRASRRMVAFADRTSGGFGTAPKFPHPAAIGFLLARSVGEDDPSLRAVVIEALDAMALGGIRDQLAGGFHRYSTDQRWVIPHFEKMSYDNSELLRVYADGHAALRRSLYAETARDTVRWVTEVLAEPTGGYGASQDADLEPGDDGSHYTWSLGQLDQALEPDEVRLAIVRFGLGTHGRMHHDPSQNVLFIAEPIETVAQRVGLPVEATEHQLAIVTDKLRAARAARPRPFVDRTRYAGWNAMMASAMLRAGLLLEDEKAVAHALGSIDRLRAATSENGTIDHGQGGLHGLLEDQVQAAAAGLDGFEATGDPGWLEWAERLMERAIATCWDQANSGFFDRPDGHEPGLLTARARPLHDNPTPSGNGVAAVVLSRLHQLTHASRWEDHRRQLLAAFAGRAEELGLFAATFFQALDWATAPAAHLVITGPADDPSARAMHRLALAAYLPRKVVVRITPANRDRLRVTPAIEGILTRPERVSAYLCIGTQCLEPAADSTAWSARLEQALTLARGGVPG
jgi:uncharacterized protein YyaL (SSP411 family)